eukprot:ANDGO_04517.mRNA.1 Uncharacterized protein YetH
MGYSLRVSHVTVWVRDQDASIKFYTEKLGFMVATDAPCGPDMRWVELKRVENGFTDRQSVRLVLQKSTDDSKVGQFAGFIFATDDIQATFNALQTNQVSISSPPKQESWGTFLIFTDIDGNSFCVSQSSDDPTSTSSQ